MEHVVPVLLAHFGVDVVTGVVEFGDLLGEQFYPDGAVAEYDGLLEVELREQDIETDDLLLVLEVDVVLGDALEGEFLHQVDDTGLLEVLVFELLDREGEGG